MSISWTRRESGTAEPAPTAAHPDLFRLTAPAGGFFQFDGSEPVGLQFQLAFATTAFYGIYIETTTSRGRRQFKFIPTDTPPRLRFGYRYEVGLGTDTRTNELQTVSVDLQTLVDEVEARVQIESVDSIFVRFGGELLIEASAGTVVEEPGTPELEMTQAEIVRFLNQTSFGASEATIAAVADAGSYAAWIDRQFALPVSLTEPHVRAIGNGSNSSHRHHIWWTNVMEGPDQLRQRLAFAWSQIFVVSDRDYTLSNSQYGICNYYDMLATLADANFRTLLERVTLHPVMGIYLSMLRNERADPARNVRPDENFAREVLQLFTIGLQELNIDGSRRVDAGGPIPTFDQATIEEFARVFTGWNYDGVRSWTDNNIPGDSRVVPMIPEEAFHDPGQKRLLNGTVLPAGQTAAQDMSDALDNIFNHPNVGPFVSRLLIQRLVTSNPSRAYIGRTAEVFNDNGDGVRGDMRAVVTALLLDSEARAGHVLRPGTFGKIKEPIMRLTNLWRAFDAQPGPESTTGYRPYAKSAEAIETLLGQAVLRAPSIFNFYKPDHSLEPGSKLDGPEMTILSEINVASTNNMLLQCIYGDNNRSTEYRQNITQIQIEPAVALAADVDALLDWLDMILAAGQLPSPVRAAISELISAHPDDDDGRYLRVVDATYCIVGSPFHLVQK